MEQIEKYIGVCLNVNTDDYETLGKSIIDRAKHIDLLTLSINGSLVLYMGTDLKIHISDLFTKEQIAAAFITASSTGVSLNV